MIKAIPIIDIFAGPGGLGEGFSSLRDNWGQRKFRLALSIEKDPVACQTLRLRSIQRKLHDQKNLKPYYSFLRGEIGREAFFAISTVAEIDDEARKEVMNAELGKCPNAVIDARIKEALNDELDWVLIGGPPCQAYSLAGRSRRANDATFEADEKHFLYREYLRILKKHSPPIFVMENVKGMLSSHHGGAPIFSRIFSDLSNPIKGLAYEIRSFVKSMDEGSLNPADFIIRSEKYGVPQSRHRVILLGVRSDLADSKSSPLKECGREVTVRQVLGGAPKIRSRLSRNGDSPLLWQSTVLDAAKKVRGWGGAREKQLVAAMSSSAKDSAQLEETGGKFVKKANPLFGAPSTIADWLGAPGLGGVIQHESRGHMAGDIERYLFASSYAQEFGVSPDLSVFPKALLPDHENARLGAGHQIPFSDRFRVQCAERASSTVVSHIAKDGHYYIHFDPSQCRSLSVREAARLQTFPEDYFFEGNRTQQYAQVGNAVPPLLANQIAHSVFDLLASRSEEQSSGKTNAKSKGSS